jgi:RNA polymerase sigma factor (sigma-70 family)
VAGDREERFRALFEGERGHLTAYALRRTGSHEDAADIVAETFLIAWERLEAVPPGVGSRLWLYATARNVLANDRRRTQRRSELTDRIASDLRRAHPLGESSGESRLEAVRVLSNLPEEDREILMLVGWEGLSSRELGTVLGCSAVAARIRLHRARTRMAQALSGSLDEMMKQPAQSRHVPGETVSE